MLDRATQEIRYQEWFARIREWSQSGLTKKQFCEEHNYPEKTFYYYQGKIRKKLAAQMNQGLSMPEGLEECGLLPAPEEARPPVIVKLDLPTKDIIPQENPVVSRKVSFTINGLNFGMEEDISPSFLAKLIGAVGHGTC